MVKNAKHHPKIPSRRRKLAGVLSPTSSSLSVRSNFVSFAKYLERPKKCSKKSVFNNIRSMLL